MRSAFLGLALLAADVAAQQTTPFTAGSATAAPGTTAYGNIAVAAGTDSGLSIPVAVIRGQPAFGDDRHQRPQMLIAAKPAGGAVQDNPNMDTTQ